MSVESWKAERYDKYMELIDNGLPIWTMDAPELDGDKLRVRIYENVSGEIRQLSLTISDIVLLVRLGAFCNDEDAEKARKALVALIEKIDTETTE